MRPIALTLFVVLVSAGSARAHAQDIAHAESLLARDPDGARAEATQLLESGASSPEQLIAIHRVLAEAAARSSDDRAAVRSYTALLALDPAFRVERTAPDELRSPYMEAAGFWSGESVRLAVEVAVAPDHDALLVRAIDPASLAARVRIRARVPGGTYAELVRPTSATFEMAVQGLHAAPRVEYSVTLIDEMGNRLHQRGTDATPEAIVLTSVSSVVGRSDPPRIAASDPTPFYVSAGIVGAIGLGAVVGGAVMHAERESLAGQWNRAECSGSGVTRADVCARELSSLRSAEVAAGVLYGVGGAALIAAAIAAAVAPSGTPSDTQAVRCGSGPGDIGVACALTF